MEPPEWQASNGYIDRIEVNNFKSYRGRQAIGPFRSFTAVVGPNGSGKSNLMDAISFVLGVRTAQLRGSLKELLYSNSDGTSEEDQPHKGYVKLIYCTDQNDQITFARHIQPSGSGSGVEGPYQSVYKINDRPVSWDAYCQKLSSFGILVKVRNFLVFQVGDIEAVAAKSPSGLTQLFEQISGSEAYKGQYETLQADVVKAEEKVSAAFARKKAVGAERKQKKEQKDEAEKFLEKQQELRELRVHHVLFTLHQLVGDRESALREKERLTAQLAKVKSDHESFDQQVDAIKRRVAGHAKERLLHEKKVKKLQADRDKRSPELIRAREALQRTSKRIKAGEKEVKELQERAREGEARVATLESDLEAVDKALADLEAEVKQHYSKYNKGAGKGLTSQDVQAEYQRIKTQVSERTAKLQSEAATLSTVMKADAEALKQAESAAAALSQRAEAMKQQVEDAQKRAEQASADAAADHKALRGKKGERAKLEDTLRRTLMERETLMTKLSSVEAQIQSASVDRREARREQKQNEAIAALKRMYPNSVYGRLFDLGRVTRRDYNLALTVALGRHSEAVFVDSERTAKEAIQYLKDQHIPAMTFVPVTTCKVTPVNERLRSGLGGSARLAVDLVQPERSDYERAFAYVFENTLVCDTVEEARHLAFGGAERHKVVAKDGTQFGRTGLITGGDAGNLMGQAHKWDEKAVNELRAQAEEMGARLRELPSLGLLKEQEAGAAQAIADLEASAQYKEAEAKAFKERASRLEADMAQATKQAQAQQPGIKKLRDKVEKAEQQLQALTDSINRVADELFAPLSQQLGVSSIREYEELHTAFEERAQKQRSNLNLRRIKIKNQLEHEQGRELEAPLERKRKELAQDAERLKQQESEVAALQKELGSLQASLDSEAEAIRGANTEVEKAEADLRELRTRGQTLASEMTRLTRAQAAAQTAAEAAESRAKDVVSAAQLDQVEVPHLPGAAALAEVADAMEVDGIEEGTQQGQATSALDTLDFSQLPKELAAISSKKEAEAAARQQQQQISELTQELEGRTPNLKAIDQYEALRQKEKELATALEEARREATDVQTAFNQVRTARTDAFNAAFEHISSEIDVIYKELTRSGVHPLGGTAYLSLESQEEPYLGGIKYTAMPPTKRFRDMEQLSGGEKTVAALALLFAIHSYRPSPFFVLDEVDAALDATNVARVAHYIRAKTRPGAGQSSSDTHPRFQSIVISLKDIFYEKADALVGVARDVELSCSKTFTFDLSAFGEPQDAE